MKKIEPKSKIVEKIADRYNLKHGDMVEVEWLREMANKEKIDMHDFRSIFRVPNRKNNDENDTSEKVMIKLYETKELEKMKDDILKSVQKLRRITQASLEEICNKFKINIWILTGIIQKRLGNKSMEKRQSKAKVLKTKKEVKTTNRLIKTTLSISSIAFEQIMADETKRARIIIKELKRKLKILKLDMKYIYGERNYTKEEIKNACLLILEKGGSIEKNFSYNPKLLFDLLANKVKYYIMSKRHREFPEILWKNIEKFQENSLTYEVWNDDMMLELIEAKDERIKTIHQEVMQILYYNKDFVYQYRENAYQIIAYKLNIPIEHLENVINEIGELMLEYKLAKLCRDGRIINMAEAY